MNLRTLPLAALFALAAVTSPPEAQSVTRMTEFPLPAGIARPTDITTGPDGNLWFVEFGASQIGRITPGSPNTITEFPIPTGNSHPMGIAAGSDGNLWFTENIGNKIGRITPGSPNTITEFVTPTISFPHGITAGPDGNLWFTETGTSLGGSKIGRITPGSSNTITEFPIPTANGSAWGITAGPDGNIWFTEYTGNKIGRITPGSPNTITEFPIPASINPDESLGSPFAITAGPDGNLWFTAGHIGSISTTSPNTITEFPFFASDVSGITAGSDGNIWYTESVLGFIVRIAPGSPNAVLEFPIPTGDSSVPFGITAGPDGNLWFTEYFANKIGRLVPVTPTPTPTPGGPTATPRTPGPITQQAYLKASNTRELYGFGEVGMSGNTIVVGSGGEASNATGVNGNQSDTSAADAGAAYVFVRNGTTWTQQAYLKASNTEADDEFGSAMAVSGDTVVISAPYEASSATGVDGDQGDNGATDAGAAYVFVRNGTTWTQQAYLKASNTRESYTFGDSVAISGNTIVVGSVGEASNATGVNGNQSDTSARNAGAAYVFVRNGTTWTQQAYLKAPNTQELSEFGNLFGNSVGVSGDTIVVGSYRDTGAAYVFVRNGTTWTQQADLKASNAEANDSFGSDVAVDGDTVVVGADGEASNATGVNGDQNDNSTPKAGAAYVFVRNGTTWSQQAYLKASNTAANYRFGFAAVSGNVAVIGSFAEASSGAGIDGDQSDDSAPNTGAAYVFVRNGTTWSQQAYLKASTTDAKDTFGSSVALDGNTVVVGADGEASNATGVNGDQSDNSATDAGAAYIFTGVGITANTPTPSATSTHTPPPPTTLIPTTTRTPSNTPSAIPTSTNTTAVTPNFTVTPPSMFTSTSTSTPTATPTRIPAMSTATNTPTPLTVSGTLLIPGPSGSTGSHGLIPAAGAPVDVFVCVDRRTCLAMPGATLGSTVTDADGHFSIPLPAALVDGNLVVLAATIDGVTIRTVVTPGKTLGALYTPLSFSGAADVGGIALDPITEAAVRLLGAQGLDNFSDDRIDAVIAAVEVANASTTFAGGTLEQATESAAMIAASDPTVQMLLQVNPLTPTPSPIPTACTGDCSGDQAVTVDELLSMVNIALGNADVSTCLAGDANHDNEITIDELLTAVSNALSGCSASGLGITTRP